MLGWLQSEPKDKLRFRFTFLGAHVAEARRDAASLTRECLLGYAVPNPSIESKGEQVLRPIACILRTMAEMDGRICRDEMIVGPLSLMNDRGDQFGAMIDVLKTIRGSRARLREAIKGIEKSRGITHTTLGHYTRLPLAVLEWSGWTEKHRLNGIYDRSLVFHELTDFGRIEVARLIASSDVRAADLVGIDDDVTAAFIRLSGYPYGNTRLWR